MLEEGMYVVKAGEGVCRIEGQTEMKMPGAEKKSLYFLLKPISNPSVRLYLPVDGRQEDVRSVMSRSEAESLLLALPELGTLSVENEKQRETLYRDAVRSCDPVRMAGLWKTLTIRRRERVASGKRSTSLDERYLSLIEKAFCSELGFALSIPKEELKERLQNF